MPSWRKRCGKDFFDGAQLMLRDALAREESCGADFREEHQSDEGDP